jgi:hypothetical protein
MTLRVGAYIWIPCEVKPGAFSDERLTRIRGGSTEWLGFVPTASLRDHVERGPTAVRAVVLDVRGPTYVAQPFGHALGSSAFLADIRVVAPLGPVAA